MCHSMAAMMEDILLCLDISLNYSTRIKQMTKLYNVKSCLVIVIYFCRQHLTFDVMFFLLKY